MTELGNRLAVAGIARLVTRCLGLATRLTRLVTTRWERLGVAFTCDLVTVRVDCLGDFVTARMDYLEGRLLVCTVTRFEEVLRAVGAVVRVRLFDDCLVTVLDAAILAFAC